MLDGVLFLFLDIEKKLNNYFGRFGWPLKGPVGMT